MENADAGHLEMAAKVASARGVEIKTTLLSGKAYNEILKTIQMKRPSLLIMGRFGLHQVTESDIGSNAENLLRLLPCNIFFCGKGFNPHEIIKKTPDHAPPI